MMGTEASLTEDQVMDDLSLQLRASQAQERAFRAEARRLARELALTRRLLRFSGDNPPPAHPRQPPVAVPAGTATGATRRRATLLTEPVIYHFDACQNRGTYTAIAGWAFRPAPGWDARATTVTLLFRHGLAVFQATATRMPRPDVAAHFAAQGAGLTGGATGLDGVGFGCEILHESLPADAAMEITLRLECAGMACEQSTGTLLRL